MLTPFIILFSLAPLSWLGWFPLTAVLPGNFVSAASTIAVVASSIALDLTGIFRKGQTPTFKRVNRLASATFILGIVSFVYFVLFNITFDENQQFCGGVLYDPFRCQPEAVYLLWLYPVLTV